MRGLSEMSFNASVADILSHQLSSRNKADFSSPDNGLSVSSLRLVTFTLLRICRIFASWNTGDDLGLTLGPTIFRLVLPSTVTSTLYCSSSHIATLPFCDFNRL